VRADEDRLAQPAELLEDLHQLDPGARVETGCRLVQQQQLRVVDQHARQGHALLHPARQALDQIVLAAGHVGQRQHIGDRAVARGQTQAVGRREEVEVLVNGHQPIGTEVVGHVADPPAHLLAG